MKEETVRVQMLPSIEKLRDVEAALLAFVYPGSDLSFAERDIRDVISGLQEILDDAHKALGEL